MKATNGWLALGLASLAMLAGCEGCRPIQPSQGAPGEIGIAYPGAAGAVLTSRDALYDFGPVFKGQRKTLKLTIKNLQAGALDLERLEPTAVDDAFQVDFVPRRLEAAEVAEFELSFSPPDDGQGVVAHEARFILRAANTEPNAETATITLVGLAVPGVCEVPAVLDFGAVAKGDLFRLSHPLQNPTQLEATASVGELYSSSGDHLAFAYAADSARGTVSLPPSGARTISIAFAPTEVKSYLAFVKLRASAQCPEYPVALKGRGVDDVLTWSPSIVRFGYVQPGTLVTAPLELRNAGRAEVSLSAVKTLLPAEYKVVAQAGGDPSTLTIPGEGTATLVLSFRPTMLGPRSSTLWFQTTLARQPSGAVPLQGFGGGPAIQVVPSPSLAFGKVAYFANANPPVFQSRKLSVLNVGTRPAVSDPTANLHLGKAGAPPVTSIVPLNADSDVSELSIALPAGYDPVQGLEAIAGKNLTELVVKLTPASAKKKEFEVTVFSDDPSKPEVKILVSADVVTLPPCNYEVVPTALHFGLVTPPSYRDLSFTVRNLSQQPGEVCLLSNLDIAPGSDPVFSLPGGPVASKELQPGESYPVLIRAWPQGQVPPGVVAATGAAQLFVSSPLQPQRLVSLQASIAAGCLTITPDDLDFGAVQKDCNSASKTVTLYNTCTSAVTLTGISVQAAAGQPAGGPACPGSSPCPELSLVSTPAIPSGGLALAPGGAPVSLSMQYRPIDLSSDSGALAVNVVQNGQNVAYLVTLRGTGNTDGVNTDVYTQSDKPQADILLVVDSSGSMGDDQAALGSNFTSFMRYAVSNSVDYHLAVTTTDMGLGGEQGKMIGDAANPKVLTPATPNVEALFQAKVNVGTSGSATEEHAAPALAALTAPLITSENAGFLRNDAALAVVVVTDALDQSPQPASFYFNALLNVKGATRANLFTYNVIGPFNPNPSGSCQYDTTADDGRHGFLVSQTSGVKEEICTPDWAKSLEELGKRAFGYRTNFFLLNTPDLTGGKSIAVAIDGAAMPKIDGRGSTVWTYDPVANSVNFEPMFTPELGQTLAITYYVTCL